MLLVVKRRTCLDAKPSKPFHVAADARQGGVEGGFHMSGWSALAASEWSFGIPTTQRLVTMAVVVSRARLHGKACASHAMS